jgi:hypothetical protein
MAFLPESDLKITSRKVDTSWLNTSRFNDILFNRGNPNECKEISHIKVYPQKYVEVNKLPLKETSGRGRGLPPLEMPSFRSQTSFELSSYPKGFAGRMRVEEAVNVMSSRPNIFSQFNPDREPWKLKTHSKMGDPRPKPMAAACIEGFTGMGNMREPTIMPVNERPNRAIAERTSVTPSSQLSFYGKRKYL